jgi:hypothetical protein
LPSAWIKQRLSGKPDSNLITRKTDMIDLLKFVKSSSVIGAIKRFVPQAVQNRLFGISMERNKRLLRKVVLEYLMGGGGVN